MHLAASQRTVLIEIYNDLKDLKVANKCKKVVELEKGIEITEQGLRLILRKLITTGKSSY